MYNIDPNGRTQVPEPEADTDVATENQNSVGQTDTRRAAREVGKT